MKKIIPLSIILMAITSCQEAILSKNDTGYYIEEGPLLVQDYWQAGLLGLIALVLIIGFAIGHRQRKKTHRLLEQLLVVQDKEGFTDQEREKIRKGRTIARLMENRKFNN